MDEQEIQLGDWERLLIGNNPWGFMIEIFIRTLIIYFFLIVVMRLLGKRMNAQLTIIDLAVMLTLGAIASVPMQAFNRGILPGILLLMAILFLHQLLTRLSFKYRKVEVLTQGTISLVVKDGVIEPKHLQDLHISKDQIFSILRSKGIRHLGQVKRLYSEADGHFSVYKLAEEKPGLSVYPMEDKGLPPATKEIENHLVCCYCGHVIENSTDPQECSNCGNKDWAPAIQ